MRSNKDKIIRFIKTILGIIKESILKIIKSEIFRTAVICTIASSIASTTALYTYANIVGANLDILPNDWIHEKLGYPYKGYGPMNINLYISNNGQKLAYIYRVNLYLMIDNKEILLIHDWTYSLSDKIIKPNNYIKLKLTIYINNMYYNPYLNEHIRNYIKNSKIIKFKLEIEYNKNCWSIFSIPPELISRVIKINKNL